MVIVSFTSSMQYLAAFNMVVLALLFLQVGYKQALLFLPAVSLFLLCFITHEDTYIGGLLLLFGSASGLLYIFFADLISSNRQLLVSALKLHIFLSVLQFPLQVYQFTDAYGIGIDILLTYASAGDIGVGTIGHSSVIAYKQILSLFFLLYLKDEYSKSRFSFYLLILLASLLFVGTNHAYALLSLAGVATLVIHARKLGRKMRVSIVLPALATVVVVSVYFVNFESQTSYIQARIKNIQLDFLNVGKVRAWTNTFEAIENNPSALIIGLGPGNYSSRAAFILSGEYLRGGIHPIIGQHTTDNFDSYMYPLWNIESRNTFHLKGTIHQPFSSFLTLLAEGGVVVFLIVSAILVRFSMRIAHCGIVPTGLLCFTLFLGMIENIIEYPRIISPTLLFLTFCFKNPRLLGASVSPRKTMLRDSKYRNTGAQV